MRRSEEKGRRRARVRIGRGWGGREREAEREAARGKMWRIICRITMEDWRSGGLENWRT